MTVAHLLLMIGNRNSVVRWTSRSAAMLQLNRVIQTSAVTTWRENLSGRNKIGMFHWARRVPSLRHCWNRRSFVVTVDSLGQDWGEDIRWSDIDRVDLNWTVSTINDQMSISTDILSRSVFSYQGQSQLFTQLGQWCPQGLYFDRRVSLLFRCSVLCLTDGLHQLIIYRQRETNADLILRRRAKSIRQLAA